METAIHLQNAGMLTRLYVPELRIQSKGLSNRDRELCALPVENLEHFNLLTLERKPSVTDTT